MREEEGGGAPGESRMTFWGKVVMVLAPFLLLALVLAGLRLLG